MKMEDDKNVHSNKTEIMMFQCQNLMIPYFTFN